MFRQLVVLQAVGAVLFLASACPDAGASPVTTGLQLWLDAQDVNGTGTQSPAGALGTWVNKGSGNDAMARAGFEPTLVLGTGPNGTDLVDFSTDIMDIAGMTGGHDQTVFWVLNQETGGNRQLLNHRQNNNQRLMLGTGGGKAEIQDNKSLNASIVNDRDYLLTLVVEEVTTDGAALFRDGVPVGTTTVTDRPVFTKAASLGAHPNGATTAPFDGQLMEMLIYDRALAADEQNQVGLYLEEKYGLGTAYGPATGIGVAFNGSSANHYTILEPEDIAGVVPAAHWNNLNTTGDASDLARPDRGLALSKDVPREGPW